MAFPTTSLLDDFNRANDPTTLGANWTAGVRSAYTSCGVISNTCYSPSTFQSNYWSASGQFAANQEVWYTITTLGGGDIRLFARIQNPGTGSMAGYGVQVVSAGLTTVDYFIAGANTFMFNGSHTFVSGDSIGLEVNGTNIALYYKPAAGSWTLDDQITDSHVSGAGYIGVEFNSASDPRVDDFGGGAISVAPTPTAADNPPIGILGRGAGW